jgi:hypothetical protein
MIACLSPDGPDFAPLAHLQNYLIEGARRRPVKDIPRLRIKPAFVAWAFEALAFPLEVDRAGEVRAFLTIRIILAFAQPYQYCRVVFIRVSEVQR